MSNIACVKGPRLAILDFLHNLVRFQPRNFSNLGFIKDECINVLQSLLIARQLWALVCEDFVTFDQKGWSNNPWRHHLVWQISVWLLLNKIVVKMKPFEAILKAKKECLLKDLFEHLTNNLTSSSSLVNFVWWIALFRKYAKVSISVF